MNQSKIWLIIFVILPGRQQTYRLKTVTDTQVHEYFNKYTLTWTCGKYSSMLNNTCVKNLKAINGKQILSTHSLSSEIPLVCVCEREKEWKDFRVGFLHTNGDKAVQLSVSLLSTQHNRSMDGKSCVYTQPQWVLVHVLILDHTDTFKSIKQRE